MKKLIVTLTILVGFAMQVLAYDFQSGNLLYTISTTDPLCVTLDGHIDGTEAQGELVIPETVTYEGDTYTVTKIGRNAFYNCMGLTGSLFIPNTVKVIGDGAFFSCNHLTGDLIIPNSVKLIESRAFTWCNGFDGQLVLPDSITTIYAYTFEGCSGLSGTLNIPNSVTEIWYESFAQCSGFTGDLIIPNAVTVLGAGGEGINGIMGAFEDCTGFNGRLVLPDSLKVVYWYCFANCYNLTGELVLPNSLEEIWRCAFSGCRGFAGELKLPDSLKYIGPNAFQSCSGFSGKLVFPDTVEEIGGEAFAWCTGFTDVELRHQVFYDNNFGSAVFMGWSLAELDIPEGWTDTGESTFSFCSNLAKIHLPESMTTIGNGVFHRCINLLEIDIPESVSKIEVGAFSGCKSLSCTFIVPDSVERIEWLTFDSCTNITQMVLGASVNYVYDLAFRNTCLESMVIKATTPPELNRVASHSLPLDLPITVPCGTLEAYLNAEEWREFTNIKEGVTDILLVLSADETAGTVRILKDATCEDRMVQVEAVPSESWEFLYWAINGEQISNENPYSFKLKGNIELVAHFSGTGLEEMEQLVAVYPNPASVFLFVQTEHVPSLPYPMEYHINNLMGQTLLSGLILDGTQRIDVSCLPSGVYLMKTPCVTRKFVVQQEGLQ